MVGKFLVSHCVLPIIKSWKLNRLVLSSYRILVEVEPDTKAKMLKTSPHIVSMREYSLYINNQVFLQLKSYSLYKIFLNFRCVN